MNETELEESVYFAEELSVWSMWEEDLQFYGSVDEFFARTKAVSFVIEIRGEDDTFIANSQKVRLDVEPGNRFCGFPLEPGK